MHEMPLIVFPMDLKLWTLWCKAAVAFVFLHSSPLGYYVQITRDSYMITPLKGGFVGLAIHLYKSAHVHFACTLGLSHSTLWRHAPIKRQDQANTTSSVTSWTAGGLVRQLCEESHSYTPCRDTGLTAYNIWVMHVSLLSAATLQLFHLQGTLSPLMWVSSVILLFIQILDLSRG